MDMNDLLLKEYIRALLGTKVLLSEGGDRGFEYEQILVNGLEASGIDVTTAAGNNNTVSDLGFSIDGVDYGAEIKLSHTDNLGALRKENFLSLVWNGETFEGEVDEGPGMADVAEMVLLRMNEHEGIKEKLNLLAQYIQDFFPPPTVQIPWNLLSSMGNSRGDRNQQAVYALMRDDKEKRFPMPAGYDPVPEGVKQLSKLSEFVITSEQIRRIISKKKAPNGASTSYIIIGNNTLSPVGSVYHLGSDPLGLGVPLYEPASVGVEIRWAAAGGEDSARRYNFAFKTKAFGGKGSPGAPFNSTEELASLLLGEIQPNIPAPESEEVGTAVVKKRRKEEVGEEEEQFIPRGQPGLPPRLPPSRKSKTSTPKTAKMSIRRR